MKKYLYLILFSAIIIPNCKEDEPTKPEAVNGACPDIQTVTYDGKVYNTVQIGNQCWLKENLDVGVRINGENDHTDNGTIEKYCYNDNSANCNNYGGLYQWNEAMQYTVAEGNQGVCPDGWHIPDLEEFNILISTVGGSANALKILGSGSGSGTGTNTSGFSALLGGYRKLDGSFSYLEGGTGFWISTESTDSCAWVAELHADHNDILLDCYYKNIGFYLRCLKD